MKNAARELRSPAASVWVLVEPGSIEGFALTRAVPWVRLRSSRRLPQVLPRCTWRNPAAVLSSQPAYGFRSLDSGALRAAVAPRMWGFQPRDVPSIAHGA